MSAPKLTMQKATLANIYQSFLMSVTNLREKIVWQSWDDATEAGFQRIQKERLSLQHQEQVLIKLGDMLVGKKQRNRKNGAKKDGIRQLLIMCPECGYKCRTSALWISVGIPKCPNEMCEKFDETMQEEISYSGQDDMPLKDALEGFEGKEEAESNEDFGQDFTCIAHGKKGCEICM